MTDVKPSKLTFEEAFNEGNDRVAFLLLTVNATIEEVRARIKMIEDLPAEAEERRKFWNSELISMPAGEVLLKYPSRVSYLLSLSPPRKAA